MKPCDDPQFHAKLVFPLAPLRLAYEPWGRKHSFSLCTDPKVVLEHEIHSARSPK